MPCNGSLDKIRLDAGFFQNVSKGVGGLRIVPACQIRRGLLANVVVVVPGF